MRLTLQRPDVVLRGDDGGVGPTILLLHAGGERRQVWSPVTEILVDAGFRCVTFDQRGHGQSGGTAAGLDVFADDVAAMLRLEPRPRVVVGASLGGLAAIAALADPALREDLWGLVLVDVVPDPEPRRVRRFLAAAGMLSEHAELVDDILSRAPWLRRTTAALRLPILLVRGGPASPLTDHDVDRLVELAPQTTVTRIVGAGHLVARDQPTDLGHAIAATASSWKGAPR